MANNKRTALKILFTSSLGVLGGFLGSSLGVALGLVIGIETAPTSTTPAHEAFFESIGIILHAAGYAVVGLVLGAISGAIAGTLLGGWLAGRRRSRPSAPVDSLSNPSPS